MTTFLYFLGPCPEFPSLCLRDKSVCGLHGRRLSHSENRVWIEMLNGHFYENKAAEAWVLGPAGFETGDEIYSEVIEELYFNQVSPSDTILQQVVRQYARVGRLIAVLTPNALHVTGPVRKFGELKLFLDYVTDQAANCLPANGVLSL